MMRLPSFRLVTPRSLDDVTAALADDPASTRLVAGGTDLLPNMKRRHQTASTLVSLRRVEALHGIHGDGATELRIGAGTTLAEICRSEVVKSAYPGLHEAVSAIASPLLRNMGTLGGNLCLDTRCSYYNQTEEWRQAIGYCMKECGETCWVAPGSSRCWAASSTDAAPLLIALGARVKLASVRGSRVIPLEDLYADDGIAYITKERDEILTEILLPPAGRTKTTYLKLRRRGSIDFPVLGVGVALDADDKGEVADVSIVLGAVRSSPVRATAAEERLRGRMLDDAAIAEASKLARKPATPLENTDFLARWRGAMVEKFVTRALGALKGD